MAAEENNIRVWSRDGAAFFTVTGSARAGHVAAFLQAVRELEASGGTGFVLDLTDCVLADSTFLGTLVGLADPDPPERPVIFTVVNPSPAVLRQMETLELTPFVRILHGQRLEAAGPGDSVRVVDGSELPEAREMARLCLEAHRVLMGLSEANRKRFQTLSELLEAELRGKDRPPEGGG